MEHIAQSLMGDRRNIAEYENDRHVPYPLARPLSVSDLGPFVDKDILVTFTVKVPLAEVSRAADGTLAEFVEEKWLGGNATMVSPEYRAVGATFEDFAQQYSGHVHLQVTCQLSEPYKP